MIYGCIGKKLGHSFSKEIHARLFDYDYELLELSENELEPFFKKREFKAINVTIPYKLAVIPYLDEISSTARAIGAVNTIVNDGGRLYGYNTDFFGMSFLIEKNLIAVKNKKALILGSGGTAKTANAVLKSLGAREILTVSRSKKEGFITYDEAAKIHSDAEIIVNTTPCGMYPNIGESAVDVRDFKNLCGVVDAVYNPLRSKLVLDARKEGIPAVGGLCMLVAQGAFAAEKFINEKVSDEKIMSVYKSLVLEKQNIVLVGMPGCGKTTIGKILSNELKMSFVDTDCIITEKTGKTPAELICEKGEKAFREIEADAVKEASKCWGSIIATGGGAVLKEENVSLLKQNGRIYFIDRALEAIIPTEDRPLSKNVELLKERYRERYPIYSSCADFRLRATNDAFENAEKIKEDFKNEATCD